MLAEQPIAIVAVEAANAIGVEPHITPEELAPFLRITVSRVRTRLHDGQIRGVKVGKQWLIPQSEVRRLLSPTT